MKISILVLLLCTQNISFFAEAKNKHPRVGDSANTANSTEMDPASNDETFEYTPPTESDEDAFHD